ncbi:glycosyltransferase family 39 protein [Candidatus Woesearchaeota archaeon]|nr:glycosyltransferase family 39 protein [Candidatus Woesearchaeota archaeon]
MSRNDWLVVLALVIGAFLFRVVGVGAPALNGDEADLYDSVLDVTVRGISPWERWGGILPPLSAWIVSAFVSVFGHAESGIRMYGAVFGGLSVFAVYFLARVHYGRAVAVGAGAIAAVMPLLVLSNRDAHPDNVLVFFSLASICLFEYAYKYQTNSKWFEYAGGLSAGLAVISKHNSWMILSIYWGFRAISALFSGRKAVIRSIVSALRGATAGVAVLLFSYEFSMTNVVYVGYGILYWVFNQSMGTAVPWYYGLSVLFDGLSPLVLVGFPVATIILLMKRDRNSALHLTLCFVFLFVVMLQGRKFPRHFLLGLPFAAIIVSSGVYALKPYVDKRVPAVILLCLVASAAGWSVYKIESYDQYVVWRNVGPYLLSEVDKDATIFVDGVEYWTLKYYTQSKRRIVSKLDPALLTMGDIAIVHALNKTSPFVIGSPLQNDLTLYSPSYAARYSWNDEFYDFVEKNGQLLKTFPYDNQGNKIHVYRIISEGQIQRSPDEKRVLDLVSQKICNAWQSNATAEHALRILLPENIQAQLTKKCTRGCVSTCEFF